MNKEATTLHEEKETCSDDEENKEIMRVSTIRVSKLEKNMSNESNDGSIKSDDDPEVIIKLDPVVMRRKSRGNPMFRKSECMFYF